MAPNPENEPTTLREVKKSLIEPKRLPTVEEMRGQDSWNNCAIRIVVSGVMALGTTYGGLGLMMGLLLGALGTLILQDEMTGKQQFIYQAKSMGRRSWSSAKAFAVLGFVLSAAECVVERHELNRTQQIQLLLDV